MTRTAQYGDPQVPEGGRRDLPARDRESRARTKAKGAIRLKMTLTSDDGTLNHVVETTIKLE